MAAAPSSQSHGGSSSEQGEGSSLSCDLLNTESLTSDVIQTEVAELMEFLTLKYLMNKTTTKAEMMKVVTKDYQEHFLMLFKEASHCMLLVFGIDVKEVDPHNHSYVLVPALGLTYDGKESNDKGYPRTILLIIVLGIIHIEENSASEEAIWEMLNGMGLYPGREHCIYGEPRKFLTKDLVQEQYLECLEVPSSDPPRYKFLWGPRAYSETSEKKVLEFWGMLKDTTLKSLSVCFEKSSEDEERELRLGSVESDN
ncbi:melanoma-associated antigen 10-like [Fukomys damarensis]|uniref:melanoma-associated antigen 10-like n=1 Tax=Fukomys damarensis TaxID=885580 RepID=UPI00053FE207|nr:melanoma-associated antigen 10-like [Fukomys damarensis]XP_010602222.1 melanoma-associated antigen 10-like [Fukomys damarensis]XP_010602231.1 melanoma-associated antigen 10-like [Fukomys damarensis]XP_010602239.1 melanoma-associated antigen 10-like [Fukomys damarensis]XP_010602245.1 melanoma-associated antigen 10-like [Fukomys damarensis]XP_010602253.1 melanoma-associated antigen 10-like [Fukomys damarensis]XP_019060094.1 melanoma-associated antigen 10-like [Fukomys damarensis]XP_01906010